MLYVMEYRRDADGSRVLVPVDAGNREQAIERAGDVLAAIAGRPAGEAVAGFAAYRLCGAKQAAVQLLERDQAPDDYAPRESLAVPPAAAMPGTTRGGGGGSRIDRPMLGHS